MAERREENRACAAAAAAEVRCLAGEGMKSVDALLLRVRDRESSQDRFVFYVDRAIKLVVEVALGELATEKKTVVTPTGAQVDGYDFARPVAAVSILRSGDAFMQAFNACMPGSPTGKLLVAKHAGSELQVLYSKLPKNLASCSVLLMDPLLATGSTMIKSLQVLTGEYGVDPQHITVLCLISCPAGIKNVQEAFPQVRIITAAVDAGLNKEHFISPGLGSFGDRYFGTR
ncbi:Uracil phosphoribosyltransferase [Hondaea fermentalgiana]|uniref:uracil phosphoribosyltransferase n=1 Tax=Hondaea fermentalgiana TaxID=2315210 RepID=A0A2R5GTM3_9STRA|nr:Uracil phosphoribosyltransferase [Hondaea fermentalgiana]|eukprot:GBG34212.1 Uracil phosphoribosyltransferase [Hondaea fermentalgiana]